MEAFIEKICKEAIVKEHQIWKLAEPSLLENKSSKVLIRWLRDNGFIVVENYCDIANSFFAYYGEPEYITYLAEYDALMGLSADKTKNKKLAGHGCLHNHIGAVNCGAAIILKKYLEEKHIKRGVAVIGCPAEELLIGKIALLNRKGFARSSVLLTNHADYQFAAVSRKCQAAVSFEVSFYGKNNHGGNSKANNALDGVEMLISNIDKLSVHELRGVSIEHVIRTGGVMANITPDKASVWYVLRDENYQRIIDGYIKIKRLVDMVGVSLQLNANVKLISATDGYLPNDCLGKVLFEELYKEASSLNIKESDIIEIKELIKQEANDEDDLIDEDYLSINREAVFIKQGLDLYSQDDGEASHIIPLGRINYALPNQIALHSIYATMAADSGYMKKVSLIVLRALYKGGVKLIENPKLIEEAKNELKSKNKSKKNNKKFMDELKQSVDQFINIWNNNPMSFWDDSWMEE